MNVAVLNEEDEKGVTKEVVKSEIVSKRERESARQ